MRVRVQRHPDASCLIMTVAGRLTVAAAPTVRRALRRALTDQPPAVIVDLSGLTAIADRCTSLFEAVARRTTQWPATVLILCGATEPVARTLASARLPWLVPVYADLDEALQRIREQPPRLREEHALPVDPRAAREARGLVRRLCDRWSFDELRDAALLVTSELVTNAVVHGASEARLLVELGPRSLTVAVTDDAPGLPRPFQPEGQSQDGRGLFLVRQLAQAWGVDDHPSNGKTVWCALRRSAG